MSIYQYNRNRKTLRVGLVVLLLVAPCVANAGGMSYSGAGAKGLGRAGAFAAGVDDPTALFYNPANLANMPGIQLGGGLQVPFANNCFDRVGQYGDDARLEDSTSEIELYKSIYDDEDIANTPFPEVCNSASTMPVPDFGLTWRVHPMVGLGIGVVVPPGFAKSQYGSEDKENNVQGTVKVPGGGRLPAPTRYMLVRANLMAAYPTIAIGVAPIERLRLGLSASWGFLIAEHDMILKGLQGEWFATDIYNEVEATDPFVPRINFSVQVVAIKRILELMAYFTWADDINAEGSIVATTGYYAEDGPYDKAKVDNVKVDMAQPWQTGLGISVNIPRSVSDESEQKGKKSDQVVDSLHTNYADIELDVIYEINNRVDDMVVSVPATGMQLFREPIENTAPDEYRLPLVWKDQLAIRLGGDWNAIQDRLALRLGFHYDTHGVADGYERLIIMPFQRIGVHAGVTVRLGRFDLTAGYGFIHQFDVELGPEDAKLSQLVSDVERGYGTVVNEGKFTSNINIVGVGMNVHFGTWI